MSTTTPLFSSADIQQIFSSAIVFAASIIEDMAVGIWTMYWPWITGIIILTIFVIGIKILAGQIDSMLGSLLYHVIFGTILVVAIVTSGFEVLFSPYFDFFYPASYLLVGLILSRLKRYFR